MDDLIPFKENAERVTGTATAAITGKTFVSISGDRNADGTYSVAPAPAGGKVFGVAAASARVGQKVTIITIPSGHIVPVTVGGAALAANASVTPDATGRAAAAVGGARASGICLTGAAPGADAQIQLTNHTA